MIEFRQKGDFQKLNTFLKNIKKPIKKEILEQYGRKGVVALSSKTPVDTGLTASSWTYKIINGKGRQSLIFYNSNVINGVPIAIILQYGHATRDGLWIEGIDYINPAIKPVFDQMVKEIWEGVGK